MQEKDFFSLFKIGDYIYPGAYARNMLIFTNQAMKRLDELVEEGYLEHRCMPQCLACDHLDYVFLDEIDQDAWECPECGHDTFCYYPVYVVKKSLKDIG